MEELFFNEINGTIDIEFKDSDEYYISSIICKEIFNAQYEAEYNKIKIPIEEFIFSGMTITDLIKEIDLYKLKMGFLRNEVKELNEKLRIENEF